MSTTTSTEPTTHQDRRTGSPILAGVDGSNDGLQAVGYATAVASRRNVDLCVVHVAPQNGSLGIPLPPVVTETLLGVGNKLAEAARDYAVSRGFPSDRLTCRVCLGHPSRIFKELSAGASAIVLGRRNLSRLERVFTGSTSQAVGAVAHCPVYVVPSGWQPRTASRSVTVGIDASDAAQPVLEAAFTEAVSRDLDLRVVYAWAPPMYSYAGRADYQDALDHWTEVAEQRITTSVTSYAAKHPGVTVTQHFLRQEPIAALLALSTQAELLVLGRSDGGELAGGVDGLGSVSRALVSGAECPVMVVPNAGDQ
ncbi:MAG: universal stress protein [Propionibacteriaceae bacterium]